MAESGTQSVSSEAAASSGAATTEEIKILRQQKQFVRKQIRCRVKSTFPPIDGADKLSSQSNKVFSRLFALPEYESAHAVGFFLSMPSGEIQTRTAIRKIVDDGKVLFVPRVGLDFEKCDMDLIRCETTTGGGGGTIGDDVDDKSAFYDDWPRNKWGIPEPSGTTNDVAKPGDIDLLIVPGLAFDAHGHRLGQGKGYYDRFIAKMCGGNTEGRSNGSSGRMKKPLLVGVCLEEQFLDVQHGVEFGERENALLVTIPVSNHDYIMDMVLTPTRTLAVQRESDK